MAFDKKLWSKQYQSSKAFKEGRKLKRNTPAEREKRRIYQQKKRRERGVREKDSFKPDLKHLLAKDVVDKRRAGVLSKGERHECALCWSLKSPDGQIFQFKNLRLFVQTHRELFTDHQLELMPIKNSGRFTERIIRQLAVLSPRRKHTYSVVHGWTWYIPPCHPPAFTVS